MVEMIIVVAIIVVLVTLVLPAASTLWAERKQADAENAIQGLLMSTRARAMQADGTESGFLAFLDDAGNQHLAAIERIHGDAELVRNLEMCMPHLSDEERTDLKDSLRYSQGTMPWQNVFVVRDEPDQVLPAPMRIVPRYVVDPDSADPNRKVWTFSDDELTNNNFNAPPANLSQRHRNYFTVVFSTSGELLVGRDVVIMDCNADEAENALGDRTSLLVGPAESFTDVAEDREVVVRFIDRRGEAATIQNLVLGNDTEPTAINFTSVDGLLVYDDAVFQQQPPAEKRNYLIRTARPIYVSRYTGSVVRGPVGGNP